MVASIWLLISDPFISTIQISAYSSVFNHMTATSRFKSQTQLAPYILIVEQTSHHPNSRYVNVFEREMNMALKNFKRLYLAW